MSDGSSSLRDRKGALSKSMDVLFPQVTKEFASVDGTDQIVWLPDESNCRVCGEPVVDGRWNYCSERCRDIAKAVQRMFVWDEVRERVLERDDYTCQRCGLSKDRWWRAYWQAKNLAREYNPYDRTEEWEKWYQKNRALEDRFMIDSPSGGLHIDHTVRIADGGHPFDESNLQTLCKYCHHEKTAVENSSDTDDTEERPEIGLDAYL